jgi:DNA-binding transcriptional ArsR family regulator
LDETAAETTLPGLGFEPEDIYVLEELEQLRAVATPLRVQILDALGARARTVREIGQELDINSTKLYYHVNELERVGLVKLVHTAVQGGIQQKFYRACAHYYFLSPDLLRSAPSDADASAGASFMTSQLDTAARALRTAYLERAIEQSPGMFLLSRRELRVSPEQARDLRERLQEIDRLASEYDDPDAESSVELVISIFPRRTQEEPSSD